MLKENVFSRPAATYLCAALLTVATAGCSSQRPVDVWAMPDMREPDPAAASQRHDEPGRYPWGLAQAGIRGSDDAGDNEEHVGDLPETGYARPRGFWRYDEAAALREARGSGRGVLLSFFAEWCDACLKLDRDTLRDGDVRVAITMRFVPLRVDVTEETHQNREQLERYRVLKLPALIMIDDSGRELARFDSYVPAELVMSQLDRMDKIAEMGQLDEVRPPPRESRR